MSTSKQRIAINFGGGYVPGLNAVVSGAVRAADCIGWEVVGIHDGYDGLLLADQYPDGGVVKLNPLAVEQLGAAGGSILGTGARIDPFRVRTVDAENCVHEVDRSDALLQLIRDAGIDAVISVVGASPVTGMHAMTVAFKLARKGLRTVCIPKSIENDVTATALAFGYNSALGYTAETLDRIRTGARDGHRIGVVEVPGENAGWLALQAGMAVCADAVLIPEIPFDLRKVAETLRTNAKAGRRPSLVVAASGALPVGYEDSEAGDAAEHSRQSALRKSMSPLSEPRLGEGAQVIDRCGALAAQVAQRLQRLTDLECFPFALGQLVRAGAPTAVDRQLGLGYGAGAVRALSTERSGVMVAFQPPELKFIPLIEAINHVRTVPAQSEFITIARALGISLGN
jgi:6-phosphofructokinase 1